MLPHVPPHVPSPASFPAAAPTAAPVPPWPASTSSSASSATSPAVSAVSAVSSSDSMSVVTASDEVGLPSKKRAFVADDTAASFTSASSASASASTMGSGHTCAELTWTWAHGGPLLPALASSLSSSSDFSLAESVANVQPSSSAPASDPWASLFDVVTRELVVVHQTDPAALVDALARACHTADTADAMETDTGNEQSEQKESADADADAALEAELKQLTVSAATRSPESWHVLPSALAHVIGCVHVCRARLAALFEWRDGPVVTSMKQGVELEL